MIQEVHTESAETKPSHHLILCTLPYTFQDELLYSYHKTVPLMNRYFVVNHSRLTSATGQDKVREAYLLNAQERGKIDNQLAN